MSSRLRRNPKRGRSWYRPLRKPIPRGITRAELECRLYGPGGPKHGLRARRDVIEKRAIVNGYLRGRARYECSGRWATTVGETLRGLMPAMASLDAKPWDAAHRPGGDEQLRHHYATALALLLDDLAAIGVLRWGGQRDNNGLWWRLEIELLDPWSWQPPNVSSQACDDQGRSAGPPSATSSTSTPDLTRRAPSSRRLHPVGLDSILLNSEEPFGEPASPAPPPTTRNAPTTPISLTCPGASAPTSNANPNPPTNAPRNGSNQDLGPNWESNIAALVQRVQRSEAGTAVAPPSHHELLAEQRQHRLQELQNAPLGTTPSARSLEEAFWTLRTQPPKFRRAEHLERLQRAVRRYERYRDGRPAGWPEAGVAAVVHAISHLPGWYGEELLTLGGVVLRFDTLTTQMRRAHKRRHSDQYLARAQRRAERRAARRAACRFRAGRRQATIRELWQALNAACRDDQLAMLDAIGGLRTPEQLRLELRDRYLLEHGQDGEYSGWRCDPARFHSLGLYQAR